MPVARGYAASRALERAGGRLDAGPRAGGGYRLQASVPITPAPVARHDDVRGTTTAPIRVLLAEDQSMVRGALVALSSMEADIDVVAEVSTATRSCRPRWTPGPMSRCSTSRCPASTDSLRPPQLRTAVPACRVLIVTTFGRPGYLRQAMEAGAIGLRAQGRPGDQLADRHPAGRRRPAGRRSALALDALSEGANPLSEREREVLVASHRAGDHRGHRRTRCPHRRHRSQPPVGGDPEGRRSQSSRGCAHRGR